MCSISEERSGKHSRVFSEGRRAQNVQTLSLHSHRRRSCHQSAYGIRIQKQLQQTKISIKVRLMLTTQVVVYEWFNSDKKADIRYNTLAL